MSLSKQQMAGVVGAGVFVAVAGGLGWMLFSAWSERGETEERLEEEKQAYVRYNEAAVFPSRASIDSVKSNETRYAEWFDRAVALAARGDRPMPANDSPSGFKQQLQGEVRRMCALPGGVEGKIAAPTFLFGFGQYLGDGGVLPDKVDVPRLTVQPETISRLVGALSEAGVHEIKSIVRVEEKKPAEETVQRSASQKKPKTAKAEDKGPKTTKQTYAFEVTLRPDALVGVLNRLASCERFAVVRGLSFRQTSDAIVEHVTAVDKAEESKGAQQTGRRRRGAHAVAEQSPAAAESRIVTDPETDEPLSMSFTIDVYDFGRALARQPDAEKPADDKPAGEKAQKKEGAQ